MPLNGTVRASVSIRYVNTILWPAADSWSTDAGKTRALTPGDSAGQVNNAICLTPLGKLLPQETPSVATLDLYNPLEMQLAGWAAQTSLTAGALVNLQTLYAENVGVDTFVLSPGDTHGVPIGPITIPPGGQVLLDYGATGLELSSSVKNLKVACAGPGKMPTDYLKILLVGLCEVI